MEFKLESFELSGLGYALPLDGSLDRPERDYQLRIIADDGTAFHSSWIQTVSDDFCKHIVWSDNICLECDLPLAGMHMKFEVIVKESAECNGINLVAGDLLESMWDSLIDAIIGAAFSKDVVVKNDTDSPDMIATTIVGIPMKIVPEAQSSLPPIGHHSITLFIRISIKAPPLEDLSEVVTPVHTPQRSSELQIFTSAEEISSIRNHIEEDIIFPDLMNITTVESELIENTQENECNSRDEDMADQEIEEEDVGPEVVDIVSSMENLKPFAPPPPLTPPPPPATASSATLRVPSPAPPPVTEASATLHVPSPPPPPATAASATLRVPSPPPPPVPEASSTLRVPSPAPPRPPPPTESATSLASTTSSSTARNTTTTTTISSEAALGRAHAPSNRHHKSRNSFIFVPTVEEDVQGIAIQPISTPPTTKQGQDVQGIAIQPISTPPTTKQGQDVQGIAIQPISTPPPLKPTSVSATNIDVPAPPPLPPISSATPPSLPHAVTATVAEVDSTTASLQPDDVPIDTTCQDATLLQLMLRRSISLNDSLTKELQETKITTTHLQEALETKSMELIEKQKEVDMKTSELQAKVYEVKALTSAYDEKLRRAKVSEKEQRVALTAKLEALETELATKEGALQHLKVEMDAQTVLLEATKQEVCRSITSISTSTAINNSGDGLVGTRDRTQSDSVVVGSSSSSSSSKVISAGLVVSPTSSPSAGARIAQRRASLVTNTTTLPRSELADKITDSPVRASSVHLDPTQSCTVGATVAHPQRNSIAMPVQTDGSLTPPAFGRVKSHSIKERSQTLSQLDSLQVQLQELVRAEIDQKSPHQRLRRNSQTSQQHNDTLLEERSDVATEQLNHLTDASLVDTGDEADCIVHPPAASPGVPPLGKSMAIREHRERARESTAELSSAAAQAAAVMFTEERRLQRLRSASPAALQSFDSLLLPIGRLDRSNSDAPTVERPASVSTIASNRSPLFTSKRYGGSMFSGRRASKIDSAEVACAIDAAAAAGGSGNGESASSPLDEEEIAQSIRELTASLRQSPAVVGRDTPTAGSGGELTPMQSRVMQRMLDRRRSQAVDAPAGGGGGGSTVVLPAEETATEAGSGDPTRGRAASRPSDTLPVLVEPAVLAARASSRSPERREDGTGNTLSSTTTTGTTTVPATHTASVMFAPTSNLEDSGYRERKMSLARYGRARFSRTQSMVQDTHTALQQQHEQQMQEEAKDEERYKDTGSGETKSSESVNTDTEQKARLQSAVKVHTIQKSEPVLPLHLQRRPLHIDTVSNSSTTSTTVGARQSIPAGSFRTLPYPHRIDGTTITAGTTTGAAADGDSSGEEMFLEELMTTDPQDGIDQQQRRPGFLFFPLELTQRDYLRRLFELLSTGLHANLLCLFRTTEHISTSTQSSTGVTSIHSVFASPPHHRHSTGGRIITTPQHHNSNNTTHIHEPAATTSGTFSWLETQHQCGADALLRLLLDGRINFKLRPYFCAKGSNIPSNDVYSTVLHHTEQLLDAYQHYSECLIETGRLTDLSELFNAADGLILAINRAAHRCNRDMNGDSDGCTESVILRLSELQQQMAEHKQYKEDRMLGAGWKWEDTQQQTAERTVGVCTGKQMHHSGKILSPVPVVASRRASTVASRSFSPSSSMLAGASNSNTAIQLRHSPLEPVVFDRNTDLSRLTPIERPRTPRSHTPPSTETGADVLMHLFRRSEATVAHLLVGQLPSNIAVIELMVCFSEIHELLRLYQEHHRNSGHREESQFLREFSEALEAQLSMDLSSIGAFKTSRQVTNTTISAATHSSADATVTTAGDHGNSPKSQVGSILSPAADRSWSNVFSPGASVKSGLYSPTPSMAGSSPLRLALTPAPTLVDSSSSKTSGGKKGASTVTTEVLDQIYIELDELSVALAEKQQSTQHSHTVRTLGTAVTPPSSVLAAIQSREDMLASKKAAWSFAMAPVDNIPGDPCSHSEGSQAAPIVRIQHHMQTGRYLLQHMHDLVSTSEELIGQLDECRNLLILQRNKEYADVDRVITTEQLRQSMATEERISAVIKELTQLSTQVKHKLAPLHLTHNEDLCALLSSKGMMSELANKLISVSLTTVTAGHREHISMCVATLLVRSKSVALVHSVFQHWPHLTLTYAVVSAETVSVDHNDRYDLSQHSTTMDHTNTSSMHNGSAVKLSTPAALTRSMNASYRAPYSLDFSSPNKTKLRSTPITPLLTSPHGGVYGTTTQQQHHTRSSQQQQQVLQVEYITILAHEADVYRDLDFSSSRSLRLLGFTLTQLRHSKCFDLKELLAAGYPLSEVKNLKTTLSVNISAKDLRLAGYSAHECLNVGFDVASLRAGGFDDYALVRSGLFNSTQLRTVGCDIQRIALMALFEALDGKHWRHKENWASATQPIGHWYGVHLDGAGHIYKLDLRSNGLKGKLPAALSLLTSLQQLDLYNNYIIGDIPEEYSELASLRDLYLGGNPGMQIDRAALYSILPNCKLRL